MAIRPDYDIGTVTLVASSANFTTTGASIQTAAVQAGDAIITPSGHVLIIASITGQNSGTLFLPCPAGAAGTNLPLRIRFQPDGSRYQGAVRNLVDLLSSGNVEAFAALVGAAGLVPIFTGPGTMDLADPATFGIQDPNGSLGKLAALTLDENKVVTTDGSGNAQQIELTEIGRLLLKLSGNAGQFVRGDGTLASILGTMASGALMEAGLNANGSYWRFRNGLQITARASGTTTIAGAAGGVFANGPAMGPYALAATFSGVPYEIITGHCLTSNGAHCWAASTGQATTTQSSPSQLFRATASAETFFVRYVHIGSWN